MMPQIIQDMDIDTLQQHICNAINGIRDIFDDFPWDEVQEATEDTLKVYQAIKFIVSIPTKLYMRKYKQFCLGLHTIEKEDYDEYSRRIGKEKVKKETYIILEIIERIEEDEKIEYINKIFKARVDNKINAIEYRRLLVYVSRTLYADLLYMKEHIADDLIPLNSIEESGLISNGWINIASTGAQKIHEDAPLYCRYSQIAFKFCELIK